MSASELWNKVRDNADPTNWVLLSLDKNGGIAVAGSGTGGRAEFVEHLDDSKVLFGAFRVHAFDDRGSVRSTRVKFVKVAWVGSAVSAMLRGRVAMARGDFDKILTGAHVDIQTSDNGDLGEKVLFDKLQASTGAHRPTGYDFNPGADSALSPTSSAADTPSSPLREDNRKSVAEPIKPSFTPTPAGAVISKGKTAYQSSTSDDGSWKTNLASNALEGKVSRTNEEEEPYWEVDLQQAVKITSVTVVFVDDAETNAVILISKDPLPPKAGSLAEAKGIAAETRDATEKKTEWTADSPVTGRYVRVQLSGNGKLALSQVEVSA